MPQVGAFALQRERLLEPILLRTAEGDPGAHFRRGGPEIETPWNKRMFVEG